MLAKSKKGMGFLILWSILVFLHGGLVHAQIGWIEYPIAEGTFAGASDVYAIDLDGDEDMDVLGAAYTADEITWWENDGNENFTKHTIDSLFDGAVSVYAIDIEPDGDIDVLGAAMTADDITWWENDGNENFTKHTIDSLFDGATSVYAIDIEPDGDIDVLGAAMSADDITWWENDGNENFTKHTIDSLFDGTRDVYALDLDDDDDVDVLGAAMTTDDITWWENDGNENFTKHTIDSLFDGARDVYALDLDDDDDVDVLGAAMTADEITWWENDGNENFTKHTIADSFDFAWSVYALDLDNDNDVDVLGAAMTADDITWWENDGNENFTKHTIDSLFDGAVDVYALDIDGDGAVDVLGAAMTAEDITWWRSDLLDMWDVGPVSIDIPATVPEDTTLYPQATVTNFGTNTETFLVTCEIDPGDYTRNRTVNDLAPGDTTPVEFLQQFTFEPGIYTVTVYTRLTDDDDPANDTLVKVIETYVPGVTDGYEDTPEVFSFSLRSNPAKGKVLFNLTLPEAGTITLRIYDITGRLVDDLVSGRKSAGYYVIPWTKDVSSGIFFYHLDSPWQQKIGKLVLLK